MNLYCDIFAFTESNIQVINAIKTVYKSSANDHMFEGHEFEISVVKNVHFNLSKSIEFPDGFLNFPFLIEVDFSDKCNGAMAIEEISRILTLLWNLNIPAVASCDYEHLLPNRGGYNSTAIPWPSMS